MLSRKERLAELSNQIDKEEKEREEMQSMVDDDAYFESYWEQDNLGQKDYRSKHNGGRVAGIVRAHTYKQINSNQIIKAQYKIMGLYQPVLMRGSRYCMIRKWEMKSAFFEEITDRYFRRIKYTCNDCTKHQNLLYKIKERLLEKGWEWAWSARNWHIPYPAHGMWWKGKFIPVYSDEYLSVMQQVDKAKAKEIERQKEQEKIDELYEKRRKERDLMFKKKVEQTKQQAELAARQKKLNRIQQIAALELIKEIQNAS